MEQRRRRGEGPGLAATLLTVAHEATPALLQRIATTEDALVLWAAHLALDSRDVPPCLRWPKRDDRPQFAYLVWLADVLWFTRRNRQHKPLFNRWAGLFTNEPCSDHWHKVALWVFKSHHKVGYYHSKGLGLSDSQRQPLMCLVSNAMRRDRKLLDRLTELRERIWLNAAKHPDRSNQRTAAEVAGSRAELLRLFVLAGWNRTLAVDFLKKLTGRTLSRQAFSRQLEAIALATGLRKLSSH